MMTGMLSVHYVAGPFSNKTSNVFLRPCAVTDTNTLNEKGNTRSPCITLERTCVSSGTYHPHGAPPTGPRPGPPLYMLQC